MCPSIKHASCACHSLLDDDDGAHRAAGCRSSRATRIDSHLSNLEPTTARHTHHLFRSFLCRGARPINNDPPLFHNAVIIYFHTPSLRGRLSTFIVVFIMLRPLRFRHSTMRHDEPRTSFSRDLSIRKQPTTTWRASIVTQQFLQHWETKPQSSLFASSSTKHLRHVLIYLFGQ